MVGESKDSRFLALFFIMIYLTRVNNCVSIIGSG